MKSSPLVAAFGALAALAGLAETARGALGPRYGGEIALVVPSVPEAFTPGRVATAAGRTTAALVEETLLAVAPDGLLRPRLADGWGSAASGREWTVRVRGDATFHDGAPVRSADAVRALRAFLRSASPAAGRLAVELDGGAAFRAGRTDALPGLEAADDLRLVLRSAGTLPPTLGALAAPGAAVVSARGAGAGPFVPTTVGARRVSLVAFSGHVLGRPFLDVIRLSAADDAAALPAAVARVDLLPLAPASLDVRGPSMRLLLVLDGRSAPFGDPSARARVASALDRADLARHYLRRADPAEALLPPALLAPLPAAGDERAPAAGGGDPERVATAGPTVLLRVATDVPTAASQRVVAHLAALGLAVRALAVTPESVLDGPAAARLFLWAPEVAEPALAMGELSAIAGAPVVVEGHLAAARAEGDPDRRRRRLLEAQDALEGSSLLVPLAVLSSPLSVARTVHGVQADLAGRLLLEDAWVEP